MTTGKWKNLCAQALVVAGVMFPFLTWAADSVQMKPYSAGEMIHYSQLKNGNKAGNLNNCIFYVDKGETIPLKLSMETDFAELKQDRIDIVARQKLYFRVEMDENLPADQLANLKKLNARILSEMSSAQRAELMKHYTIYVSKDAIHWAPLEGKEAVKQVLGFKGGLLSFVIVANTSEGLEASLDVRTTK